MGLKFIEDFIFLVKHNFWPNFKNKLEREILMFLKINASYVIFIVSEDENKGKKWNDDNYWLMARSSSLELSIYSVIVLYLIRKNIFSATNSQI